MEHQNKIIWAIDAFSENKELLKKSAKLIGNWVKNSKMAVEPVFVMSPDQLQVPSEIFVNLKEVSEDASKKQIARLLKGIKIPGLLEPTLLPSFHFSLTKTAETLLEYARTTGAEVIAVSTQSKKGVARFLFGSFAETLILHSDVPVLLVSPKMKVPQTFKHVFYATDLSDKSKQDFSLVCALAERHRMKLTLYNKVDYLTLYTAETITTSPEFQKYLKEDLENRQTSLAQLAERAKKMGLSVNTILNNKPGEITAHTSILKAAKKTKADLIAMSSKTGPVATAVLGSVTRQVLRNTDIPVWIIHPKKDHETKETRHPNLKLKKGLEYS